MAFISPQKRRQRSADLRQIANKMNMDYSRMDEWGLKALLQDFELFQKGHRRRITNLMSKSLGILDEKVSIFDYQYTISTGKSSSTFYQTVFFMQSKQLDLPEMLIYPENFFHKIGSFFGMQDIDFQEFPDFSTNFLVQGDEWRIRRTIDEDLSKFFLVERHWCLESLGYYLVFYRRKRLVKPKYIQSLFNKGMSIYNHFKTEQTERERKHSEKR